MNFIFVFIVVFVILLVFLFPKILYISVLLYHILFKEKDKKRKKNIIYKLKNMKEIK